MASKTELYDRLGLEPNASLTEIKRAARKLLFDLHPDRQKADDPEAEEKRKLFDSVTQAKAILTDETKRAEYDETGIYEGLNISDEVLTEQATGRIKNAWIGLLDRLDDAEYQDLQSKMLEVPVSATKELNKQEEDLNKRLRKYRRVRSRTKNRKGKKNIYAVFCEGVIETLEKQLKSIDEERRVLKRVVELLSEHGFDHEFTEEDWERSNRTPRSKSLPDLSGKGRALSYESNR